MIRPEWIILTSNPAGDGVVVDREHFGHDQMLRIERPDGTTVTCRVGARPTLQTDDRITLSVDEKLVYPVD